jgi:hypothetical protein
MSVEFTNDEKKWLTQLIETYDFKGPVGSVNANMMLVVLAKIWQADNKKEAVSKEEDKK